MTSAEFRTLREACGLSQQAAADFHQVALRTIAHWETGRNAVPVGAAQELLDLNASIERGVQNILSLARELSEKHGAPEAIALTRYRSTEDYAGSRAAREGLLWPCHNALVARAMIALQRVGFTVAVAWAGT